jgi:site-specific DNA-methyltransferase (adenine-specific)
MSKKIGRYNDVILPGDAKTSLQKLPSELVSMVVTSPPYFGHRQYATDPDLAALEVGRETDLNDYVDRLVETFLELKRVLKDDGTFWLNIGDTYRDNELLGIPWRVALALKDTGWLLRSEVIWHKPNAMPSSVKTRPTTAHEHVFMFSKSKTYLYNGDAIREPHVTFSEKSKMKGGRNHFGKRGGTPESGKFGGTSNLHNGRWDQAFHPLGRNRRTVWEIPLGKCRDAHFAVFPPALVEVCIKAGSREGDLILDPFMGAGTTAMVAKQLNRNYLGLELVPEYISIAKKRVSAAAIVSLSGPSKKKTRSKKAASIVEQRDFFKDVSLS